MKRFKAELEMTGKKSVKQIFYRKINMNINQCLDCKIKNLASIARLQ